MRRFQAPSPALVISLAALFVALGGTGYAAGRLSAHSTRNGGTLPSGHSESGIFGTGDGSAVDDTGYIGLSINYPQPLAKPIADAHIIDVHGKSGPHCPGAGRAARGYLCLYNEDYSALINSVFYSNDGKEFPASGGKLGVLLYWSVDAGSAYVGGEWTVTAP
jgi:hypothetical protein